MKRNGHRSQGCSWRRSATGVAQSPTSRRGREICRVLVSGMAATPKVHRQADGVPDRKLGNGYSLFAEEVIGPFAELFGSVAMADGGLPNRVPAGHSDRISDALKGGCSRDGENNPSLAFLISATTSGSAQGARTPRNSGSTNSFGPVLRSQDCVRLRWLFSPGLKSGHSNLACILLLSQRQHRQIQLLVNLPDVVLRRQHPMHVLVNRHPAVALGVAGAAIELTRGLRQLSHELSVSAGRIHEHGAE